MGWWSRNGVFLAVFLLVSSSTIAQERLEQTTLSSVADSSNTLRSADIRNEDANTQSPSNEDSFVTDLPSVDDSGVINQKTLQENDESDGSEAKNSLASTQSSVAIKSETSVPDIEDNEGRAQTVSPDQPPEETVEPGKLIETGNEGQQEDAKFSSPIQKDLETTEAMQELEEIVEPEQELEENTETKQELEENTKSEQELEQNRKPEQELEENTKDEQELEGNTKIEQELEENTKSEPELGENTKAEQELEENTDIEQELEEDTKAEQELEENTEIEQELEENTKAEQELEENTKSEPELEENRKAEQELEENTDIEQELEEDTKAEQELEENAKDEQELEENTEAEQELENTPVKPESVQEKVDYSRWRIYKVEGFGSSPSATLRDPSNTEEARGGDDVDVLVRLEENPKVKVLHENLLQNFFQIAVSPDAESRADILSNLESQGFTVQDTDTDLGRLIAEVGDGVFRSELPKGAVTFDTYMTYEQIEDFIIEFTNLHPQIVTRKVIGKSVEGRNIHMLTLTLGANSAQKSLRKSRQVSLEPEQSYPAIHQTIKALERIIRWSDSQTEEEVYQEVEDPKIQDEIPLKSSERMSSSRRREDGPSPGFLEHMMYNMPYEVINEDELASGVVSDTYSTLNKIINVTQGDSEDYSLIDFPNEPPEVQVAYKVLQKIMNYDQNDRARKILSYAEGLEDFDVGSNRIAKSFGAPKAAARSDSESADIDEEAEILFIVTSIIPSEYADNKTMIDSISDSVRIIMRNVPRGDALTDEVVQRIAPQIVQIPGVVGIASDSTRSKFDLVSKLDKILRSRNTLLTLNKSDQLASDQKDQDADLTFRVVDGKPVIFIDGGIHAREWISPAFLLYAASQLVENTELLLGAEWQLVPVLNPDGYVHTWKIDRMWRKNRGQGSIWCTGVDLNRNFGYKHGGKGSSSNHCSEIYRGPSAFSEPESQALKSAVESVKDRMMAYVTVHSYGQMILHPWGYDQKIHPDSEKMEVMGKGMSDAMRAINGEKYVVGSAAGVLYPAAGGSDDWVSSLGVPYSYTLELRDTGKRGFILPASQILPTVKETWAGIKYLGEQVIRESPRLHSAIAPTAISQTGMDMLAALQGVGVTSNLGEPILHGYPSLVPIDNNTPSKFRSGIQVDEPSSSAFPSASLVPVIAIGTSDFNLGNSQPSSGVAPPNAHFKQSSNVGLPKNDLVDQKNHGIVVLESNPSSSSGPFLLSHFAEPAIKNTKLQNQEQSKYIVNQGQIQMTNKFRDSLSQYEPAVSPIFSASPILQQSLPQYNVPYPALLPIPQFLPGIHAESVVGGSAVPYNSPMFIKPSFFGSDAKNDQLSFRYHPSIVTSQGHQTQFSNNNAQSQTFNPSLRISEQPFRPILQPLPTSPAQAHFKTNIHAVTASEVPEAEPKFAHPFLDSPNILVSIGSPQRPDPNAFRYDVPQNGAFSVLEYPRFIRRRGLPLQQ